MARSDSEVDARGYWAANLRLTTWLMVIWFVVSCGAGIVFREFLDQYSVGGAPMGFWFAQQGSIYVFVGLIFYYCVAMRRLERKFGLGED
ncbi:MAG: DUF4212 domain-containing protein [Pseudomonadota bacterium]